MALEAGLETKPAPKTNSRFVTIFKFVSAFGLCHFDLSRRLRTGLGLPFRFAMSVADRSRSPSREGQRLLMMPPLPKQRPPLPPLAGLSSINPEIVELADLVDAEIDRIDGEVRVVDQNMSDRLDCEVGVIMMKIENLNKTAQLLEDNMVRLHSSFTERVETMMVRLETLERELGNVLRQLGSFWAQRFFPPTRWGGAGP